MFEKAHVTLPSDREVKVERSFKAPRALVYRAHTEPETIGVDYPGSESLVTISFTEEDGVTRLTSLMDFGSKDARDAAIATGMTDGMEQSYALLDRRLGEEGTVAF